MSYKTIRQWCGKFGPDYARRLKRRQGRLGDTWFLDEVFVAINGQRQYLWRAVDQDGDLTDLLVQPRRDGRAVRRFLRLWDIIPRLDDYRPGVGPDSLTEISVAWTRKDYVRLMEVSVDALHDLRVRRQHACLNGGRDPQMVQLLLEVEETIAMDLIPNLWPEYEAEIKKAAASRVADADGKVAK